MVHASKKFADSRGDDVALIDEERSMTWSELDTRTNQLLSGLRGGGLGFGDIFSVLTGNRCEYFEVMSAGAHAGQQTVPINWHWSAEELAYVIEDSGSKAFIVDGRFRDVALEAVDRLDSTPDLLVLMADDAPDGWVTYEELLASGSSDEPSDQSMGGPMFYTSGTTGFPKGVKSGVSSEPVDPALIELTSAGFRMWMGYELPARFYLNGPGYHSAQWAWSVLPLVGGASVVMTHKFDPAECLRVIDEHQVTHTHLVPTQFIRLLKLPADEREAFDGSSLKEVWHGAAPCPPEVKRQMIEWWGPNISEYYGGTEGGIISLATADQWLEHPGTVGSLTGSAEVRILDDDGVEQPAGSSGQIWFKSATGRDFEYHNAPDKTAAAHREGGWGTLGDIGYFDDEGLLYLSDRKIDMIISGGVNIYPAEIEGCLVTHPAVKDSAVFGIPHDEMGEEVKAAVELTEGHEPSDDLARELMAHVREHLAGYKVPRSVDFEAEFPRHPTGKLYKRLLRDPYWEGTGRSM